MNYINQKYNSSNSMNKKDYFNLYQKYKRKYLDLKAGAASIPNELCMSNFKSIDEETKDYDCWFDTGIFLFFGNPIVREYFKNLFSLEELFTFLEGNNITLEFRKRLLEIMNENYSILKGYNDLQIFTNFFNNSINYFTFEIIESDVNITKPILLLKGPHKLDKNLIVKNKEYELKSAALLSIGAETENRPEHYISIFECNNKWFVADNQTDSLVEYNLDAEYKQLDGLYHDFSGWSFNKSINLLLYFPKN